jgi:hypothetical protein
MATLRALCGASAAHMGDTCIIRCDMGICHVMGRNDRPELDEVLDEMRQVLSDTEARPELPHYEKSADDPEAWSVPPPGGFAELRRSLYGGPHARSDDANDRAD